MFMRKLISILLMLTLMLTGAYADITITGDARVRPRLDIKDDGEYGNKTEDFYYYYRGRILLSADIGDGYFFKTHLGHNGVNYWNGLFGTGDTPHSASLSGAGRSSVDFMELYFGHVGETVGWSAGIIPVSGTPLKDIHFYPTLMVDLPYVIFNNSAAHGFDLNYMLAGNKLDLKILVDDNAGKKVSEDGDVIDSLTTMDQYTFDLSYPVSLFGFKLAPELLLTVADEGGNAPITYGAEFALPKVAGFGLSAFAGLTNQTVADTITGAAAYSGWIGRAKMVGQVGPGVLTAWYDIAATTHDVGDVTTNFSYLWLSYTYVLHKSDMGVVSLAPTYRLYTKKIEDNTDYRRAKLELTTQITFK